MSTWEYKTFEIQVNRLSGPRVPENLGARVDALGADGWELDRAVPILAKGWTIFGGSYTESLLLFFRRPRAS